MKTRTYRISSDARQYDVYALSGEYVTRCASFTYASEAIDYANENQQSRWRAHAAEYIVVNRYSKRIRYSALTGEPRHPRLFGVYIPHPVSNWQERHHNWINGGPGPQRMAFRREPDRESIAWRKLEKELESHPIVVWGD